VADRPSKKERRDLAKQARIEAERRSRRANARRRVVSFLSLLAVIGLIAGLFIWQSSKSKKVAQRVDELAQELNCEGMESFESVGSNHVPEGEITYPRMPPESGDHRPSWANTGVFDTPLETELTTHNLEHGAVVIHYAETVSETVVSALRDVALTDPQWVILAPYTEFSDGQVLSMTAWQHRVDCSKTTPPDAAKYGEMARAFIDARKNKGPESVPGTPNDTSEGSEEPEDTAPSGDSGEDSSSGIEETVAPSTPSS
jgi:hypothetical protein